MANFIFDDLKKVFQDRDNMMSKIIVLNVIIFVLFNIIDNLVFPISKWFALPGNFFDLLLKPWTIVTYMFLHGGLFHILFNMLWLYWMGKILIEFVGIKRFTAAYFLGGLAGGLAFIIMHNIFGIFGNSEFVGNGLIGASAGVMSIVFAAATVVPDYTLRLFLLGDVKLKYLAVGALVLTSLLDFSVNTGGKIAHLGGAAFGYLFIKQLQNGFDMSKNFHRLFDTIEALFSSKPKMRAVKEKSKVTSSNVKNKKSDNSPNFTKTDIQKKTDDILDKISKSGYDSLTKEEKDFLFRVSKED